MKAEFAAACAALSLALAPFAYAADKAAENKEPPSTVEKALDKTNEVIDDSAITAKIKAEYAKDKTVSAMKIHIETDKGVVKLTGNAKSKAEAAKAVQIAKSAHGVTSVRNQITVGGGKK
jgi:hyperosmotically inducible protein